MGVFEIAEAFGVSRQRVHQLAARPDFPGPHARLHAGAIWRTADIERWRDEMRTMTGSEPNVPPRDPERPQNDPWDSDAVRYLLTRSGGAGWKRVTLFQCLRGESRYDSSRVEAARAFAAEHDVRVAQHSDGKTCHFFRSDLDAPHPYPSSEAERRAWRANEG